VTWRCRLLFGEYPADKGRQQLEEAGWSGVVATSGRIG
jgi:hypothetical protein